MAQQTQLSRVVPAWLRFVERFATPTAAAEAAPGEIVEMWSGLGYNRRAVMLHASASRIVTDHRGDVPSTLDDLLALPGVGPYTARAVLVFAFEQDVAVVDTNVGRVLARLAGRSLDAAEVQRYAAALVAPGTGWEWNQALLDFGALVCSKRAPDCLRCPVADACCWRGVGPDPAIGSAQVSTGQSRFAGSDRQGRGRLVAALRHRPVVEADLADVMGWPGEEVRARRVASTVVADGLARLDETGYRLP